MEKFKLELLGDQTKQDKKDGLEGIKKMYPKAKVKVIKDTKKVTIYEVTTWKQ